MFGRKIRSCEGVDLPGDVPKKRVIVWKAVQGEFWNPIYVVDLVGPLNEGIDFWPLRTRHVT
jgi:hypothetical protein